MPFRSALVLLVSLFGASAAKADVSAAEMARRLHESGFDAKACYRIHELEIDREDLRIYLSAGHLLLARAINGLRTAALFTADVEAGDGEVLLIPPNRSERLSLVSFTDSPTFEEHFQTALMIFADDTGAELQRRITEQEQQEAMSQADESRGAELAAQWTPTLRNIYASFDTRLVQRLVSPGAKGFFFATVAGRKHRSFDLEYEYAPTPRIVLGQLTEREGRTWFDTWTAFPPRSSRMSRNRPNEQGVSIADYHMNVTLDPKLTVSAVTRARVTIQAGYERAIPFYIASGMHVTEASVDGEPAEVFESESLRAALIRGGADTMFLVVPHTPLQPGRGYQLEFHHRGDVVSPAGNGVYFVGARGSWYPHQELEFSSYDIHYTWPRALDLVSTGDLVESQTIGDMKTARFRTSAPTRLAGFNLGTYEHRSLDRNGFRIEVCANTSLEASLKGKEAAPRLDAVAVEVGTALDFMTARFGPAPVKSVTVAPIPGSFGQGFPGLIYLSTLAYVEPADRPAGLRDNFTDVLFSDLMVAHETAHQWWGNLIAPATFEDDWLAEALANYTALMYLSDRDGPQTLHSILEAYRRNLIARGAADRTVESAGPITWGVRLSSSQLPDAWRIITYEKGSWIMHMLRERLGEEKFTAFLGELCRRYAFRSVNTEEFRVLAAKFLPPRSPDPHLESFFDTWVYGTGVPRLKFRYSLAGTRITGSIEQSGVADDFSALVPVEVQMAHGERAVYWVETGSEPVSFAWSLPDKPVRAALKADSALVTIQE